MKKLVSILLALLMAFSAAIPAFAAEEKPKINYDGDPVIVVRGIDFGGLTYEDGSYAMEFTTEDILKTVLGYITAKISGNSDALLENVLALCKKAFGPIACDKNGNTIENVSMEKYPLSMDNYIDEGTWEKSEGGLVHTLCDKIGGENTYFFTYDWRKTPGELAAELNAFIDEVKKQTGKSQVDLAACSMGGMVTTAYFSEYAEEKEVDSATFFSAAQNGTYVAGAALSGEIVIDADYVVMYLESIMKNANPVLKFLLKAVDYTGFFDNLSDWLNGFILKNKERVYDELLRDYLGCCSGLWTMCPDEYYDKAVDYIFKGHEDEYAGLLAKLDTIRGFVMSTEKTLEKAKNLGINLSFVSHYNSSSMPIYERGNWQSDMVIESALTSNGGTFALYGETLSDDYLSKAEQKYISPDKVVDASTALYKDNTWFVKNTGHIGCNYGSEHADFAIWVITSDNQPTVTSNALYPQFLVADKDMNFVR